jgi:DTW domain-containing protein YfiP
MVHQLNCFCNKIEKLDLKTKVSILLFKKEVFLPSNTAHLTIKSLSNSQDYQRGHLGQVLPVEFIAEDEYQPLYLFPTEDAQELTPELLESFDKPINLIVPDGTWRQAKKVHRREPLLTDVPRVKITPDQKSIYPLRRQKFEFGLCTHEAISYALGILEGTETKSKLMNNLKIFIDAHLVNRPIFEKEKS